MSLKIESFYGGESSLWTIFRFKDRDGKVKIEDVLEISAAE